jgi:hypothetical protein
VRKKLRKKGEGTWERIFKFKGGRRGNMAESLSLREGKRREQGKGF